MFDFTFFSKLGTDMITGFTQVVGFLSQEFEVLGYSFTAGDALFGGFLTTLLGFIVVKFVLDVWPG